MSKRLWVDRNEPDLDAVGRAWAEEQEEARAEGRRVIGTDRNTDKAGSFRACEKQTEWRKKHGI